LKITLHYSTFSSNSLQNLSSHFYSPRQPEPHLVALKERFMNFLLQKKLSKPGIPFIQLVQLTILKNIDEPPAPVPVQHASLMLPVKANDGKVPKNYKTVPCKNYHGPFKQCLRTDSCHFIHCKEWIGKEIPRDVMLRIRHESILKYHTDENGELLPSFCPISQNQSSAIAF